MTSLVQRGPCLAKPQNPNEYLSYCPNPSLLSVLRQQSPKSWSHSGMLSASSQCPSPRKLSIMFCSSGDLIKHQLRFSISSISLADKVKKVIVRDVLTNISTIMITVWKLTDWKLITKQRPKIPQTWPRIHSNLGLFSKEKSLISTIEVFQVQTFTVTLLLHIQSHWKCIQVVHKCTSVVEEVLRPLIQ